MTQWLKDFLRQSQCPSLGGYSVEYPELGRLRSLAQSFGAKYRPKIDEVKVLAGLVLGLHHDLVRRVEALESVSMSSGGTKPGTSRMFPEREAPVVESDPDVNLGDRDLGSGPSALAALYRKPLKRTKVEA